MKAMNRNNNNNNPLDQNENKPKERINLNDYYRKDDSDILKQNSSNSRESAERGLDQQMGDSDDTVTGEPNHI
jgi:hypothetical protein